MIKITIFRWLSYAKRKAVLFDGKFAKIKLFTNTLICFENGENTTGAYNLINLFHVWIFTEQFRYFVWPNFFYFALY